MKIPIVASALVFATMLFAPQISRADGTSAFCNGNCEELPEIEVIASRNPDFAIAVSETPSAVNVTMDSNGYVSGAVATGEVMFSFHEQGVVAWGLKTGVMLYQHKQQPLTAGTTGRKY